MIITGWLVWYSFIMMPALNPAFPRMKILPFLIMWPGMSPTLPWMRRVPSFIVLPTPSCAFPNPRSRRRP